MEKWKETRLEWFMQHHPEVRCWRAEEPLSALMQMCILYTGWCSLLKMTTSIHSAFSVFSHSAGPWIFHPVMLSSESVFFILLAEYHWIGLLRAVQCCFSSSWLRVLLNDQTLAFPAKPARVKLSASADHGILVK